MKASNDRRMVRRSKVALGVSLAVVLQVALGCNREAALDDFSVSSLAGIGVGDDIRAYVDGADGVDLDAILSAQGNADIRKLRSVNQKGVAKVRGVLVERGSGKIARASAVLDAWDGDESRVRAKFAEIVSRYDGTGVPASDSNASRGGGEIEVREWTLGEKDCRCLHRIVLCCENGHWSIRQEISNLVLMGRVIAEIAAQDAEKMKRLVR